MRRCLTSSQTSWFSKGFCTFAVEVYLYQKFFSVEGGKNLQSRDTGSRVAARWRHALCAQPDWVGRYYGELLCAGRTEGNEGGARFEGDSLGKLHLQ